ncbi:MAG: alpha/beta hydrolase [Actinomycetia bacterium]|nr:alpha/beta hydrolase [Actinomycetes bacterium]
MPPEPHCHVRVRGSGPPLLLIHGVAGSGLIWSPVAEVLEEHFQLIAVDLLGYGHSPKPHVRYTPELHVEAIHRSVDHIIDGRPFSLVGLSMGALLTADYAARHPEGVEAIVGIGLPYYRDEPEARRGLNHNLWTGLTVHAPPLARLVIGTLWGAGRHSAALSKLLAPRIYAGEVARESMMAPYHSFSSTLQECLVAHRAEPGLAATAHVPTTLLHGTDDTWCPVERIEALVASRPNCTLHVVEGGHNLVVLAPDEVARLVVAALG